MIGIFRLGFIAVPFVAVSCVAQVTTTTNCNINSTGPNSASADCDSTSVDQGAQTRANNEAAQKLGENTGKAVGGLIGLTIRNHADKKRLKQYCEAHPGELYEVTLPNGTVSSTGKCDGAMSTARVRELLTQNLCAGAIKAGKACFVTVQGDVMTTHSERASLVRYHMVMSDAKLVQSLKQAELKTYIYTNDSDQKFEYDVATGKDTSTDEAKK
jgi:hypothetical protein